eukprot:761961-Hanusia_phi.AAC.4
MGAENVDLDQIISRLDAGEYETADVLVQEVDNVFDTVIDLINSSEDKNEGIENLELMNRARFLKSEFSQVPSALLPCAQDVMGLAEIQSPTVCLELVRPWWEPLQEDVEVCLSR